MKGEGYVHDIDSNIEIAITLLSFLQGNINGVIMSTFTRRTMKCFDFDQNRTIVLELLCFVSKVFNYPKMQDGSLFFTGLYIIA